MNGEKVKEIKNNLNTEIKLAELNKTRFTELISVDLIKDILTLINELESENDTLHTNLCEYRRENKELGSVISIANEREYRKKFNDDWRKEYQKELDKQGNGHIAGYPDFDLVYKLYFEQKDRIAKLENENQSLKESIEYGNEVCKECQSDKDKGKKWNLKQFAEELKEICTSTLADEDGYIHNAYLYETIDDLLKNKYTNRLSKEYEND